MPKFNPVTGMEAYFWPEFQAFAKRLGVGLEWPTTDLTITLPLKGIVRIAHDYNGDDRHLSQPKDEEWEKEVDASS